MSNFLDKINDISSDIKIQEISIFRKRVFGEDIGSLESIEETMKELQDFTERTKKFVEDLLIMQVCKKCKKRKLKNGESFCSEYSCVPDLRTDKCEKVEEFNENLDFHFL